MATLAAFFRPEDRALLEQLSERLRGAKTVDERARVAWPAIEKHFTPVVGHYLELGLNRFLPQVQFISEPGALYARGRALMSPDSPLKDFEEAAQCFHKAADLGHGGAQLWLGSLYEQGKGVPRDYAAALSWYRKAFEKHEPHASCRIADLYREGKGVTLNRDEAAGWYLIEAEKNCAGAQYNLGQIRESQQNLAEALKWYRRASEGGLTAAQVHLADLLTDGFSAPLDYVEACQWLLLATQAENNRITQVQLRRIKSKLTPPQLEEAQGRAEAIGHRLEEQKRASEK
jgi:TPR repeat protein